MTQDWETTVGGKEEFGRKVIYSMSFAEIFFNEWFVNLFTAARSLHGTLGSATVTPTPALPTHCSQLVLLVGG